jgi:type 1 fimbria pilin
MAGSQESSDSTTDGGNVYVSFVSSDGTETRSVSTPFPDQQVELTVSARTDAGQLRIEILDPQDSVVMALDAQPTEQYRPATVTTDESGNFRYRIRATGAQNGEFQILYQPGG